MSRIKCFLIEKTDQKRIEKMDPPCSCGRAGCGDREIVLWRRLDTGEIGDKESFPAGAMWFAPWYTDVYVGLDGRCLVVRTPGGEWIVDSEASNCTRKGDKTHRCWLRHGEAPDVTVDKDGPNTCAAGAGSILMTKAGGCQADYHGFLRGGYLESC